MTYRSFDETTVKNLQTIMGDDLFELYRVYARDSKVRIGQLESYLQAASGTANITDASKVDASKIRLAAHSLKGSSANVGASAMAELCFRLETMALENALQNSPPVLAEIKSLYQQMQPELTSLANLPQ